MDKSRQVAAPAGDSYLVTWGIDWVAIQESILSATSFARLDSPFADSWKPYRAS